MSIEVLRQIAAEPLPRLFTAKEDIDAIKILRQAGLVLATFDHSPEGAAKVLAITDRGREELLRFHYPGDRSAQRTRARSGTSGWLRLVARRAARPRSSAEDS
ncbi:MAG: hypothetical protein JWQ73_778 [Variovorax sp.]|jgi:hypothetical protein|nr:hypothetical protein [Variovorax sp.]